MATELIKAAEPTIFESLLVYNNMYDPTMKSQLRPDANNTIIQDVLSNPDIFNIFLQYEKELKSSSYTEIALMNNYDFRPDKLANEYYGNQLYYPVILIMNDLCSIMQFRVHDLNYSVKLPSIETVQNIITKINI